VGDLKRKVWGIIFLGFYAPFIVWDNHQFIGVKFYLLS
jgi:hypothetical protein